MSNEEFYGRVRAVVDQVEDETMSADQGMRRIAELVALMRDQIPPENWSETD